MQYLLSLKRECKVVLARNENTSLALLIPDFGTVKERMVTDSQLQLNPG
jgi:hypothetical protein